jgi:hypothetical protein
MEGAAETKGSVKQDRAGAAEREQEAALRAKNDRPFYRLRSCPDPSTSGPQKRGPSAEMTSSSGDQAETQGWAACGFRGRRGLGPSASEDSAKKEAVHVERRGTEPVPE